MWNPGELTSYPSLGWMPAGFTANTVGRGLGAHFLVILFIKATIWDQLIDG